MKNIEMTVEGETLIIKVDLSKDFGPSKSGKTIIIASTEGNVSVPEFFHPAPRNIMKVVKSQWNILRILRDKSTFDSCLHFNLFM
jgi:hypothetical protein